MLPSRDFLRVDDAGSLTSRVAVNMEPSVSPGPPGEQFEPSSRSRIMVPLLSLFWGQAKTAPQNGEVGCFSGYLRRGEVRLRVGEGESSLAAEGPPLAGGRESGAGAISARSIRLSGPGRASALVPAVAARIRSAAASPRGRELAAAGNPHLF